MEQSKGITITSLLIYLIAMTIAIGTLATISSNFYKNIDSTEATTSSDYSYLKLTKFIVKEINTKQNEVIYPTKDDGEKNYIIFSKTNNQYEFKDGSIYMNKIKICSGIKECTFTVEDANIVTVNVTTKENKPYTNTYYIRDI